MEKKSTIQQKTFEEDVKKLSPQLGCLAVGALDLMVKAQPRWLEYGVQKEFKRNLKQLIIDAASNVD